MTVRCAPAALMLGILSLGALGEPVLAHHTSSKGGCSGGEPVLLVPPLRGDGYIHLTERYAREGVGWREIRKANSGRGIQVGRSVRIPLPLLKDELRAHALHALFPEMTHFGCTTATPSTRRKPPRSAFVLVRFRAGATRLTPAR